MIREGPPSSGECDVCIIGSGPIGIALALECEALGKNVMLLESGRLRVDARIADASRAAIVDPRRHAPMDQAVCRAFGGTSRTWGGRCVAFDDIDFEERSYVPHSGWPISHHELSGWYRKATQYLLCGTGTFTSPSDLDLGNDASCNALERWSVQPRLAATYQSRIQSSRAVTICLNSTVVDLDFARSDQAVQNVVVASANGLVRIKSRQVVVAAGGVETTRLLLAIQRRRPAAFGGPEGALGRYYMGHISGKIATIRFRDPQAAKEFDFFRDESGAYVRRRLALSQTAQRRYKVLNTAFWLDNPPFSDPSHRNPVLSGVFLALAVPFVGRRFLPEPIRLIHVGTGPHRLREHFANVARSGLDDARNLSLIIRDRLSKRPRKPGFLLHNTAGRYALQYHAEQIPDPQSRITLTGETDAFGMPRVAVDLRFNEPDARSVIASHNILDDALRKSGVGALEFWYRPEETAERVLAQASDGFHQVGTTRLGLDPKSSVVNPNLRVHDVPNLYVASTSVFPTTGQANSTLLGVALAVRLAHLLAGSDPENVPASATNTADEHETTTRS
jgi:choline dehydrogenase-like flavoprotein